MPTSCETLLDDFNQLAVKILADYEDLLVKKKQGGKITSSFAEVFAKHIVLIRTAIENKHPIEFSRSNKLLKENITTCRRNALFLKSETVASEGKLESFYSNFISKAIEALHEVPLHFSDHLKSDDTNELANAIQSAKDIIKNPNYNLQELRCITEVLPQELDESKIENIYDIFIKFIQLYKKLPENYASFLSSNGRTSLNPLPSTQSEVETHNSHLENFLTQLETLHKKAVPDIKDMELLVKYLHDHDKEIIALENHRKKALDRNKSGYENLSSNINYIEEELNHLKAKLDDIAQPTASSIMPKQVAFPKLIEELNTAISEKTKVTSAKKITDEGLDFFNQLICHLTAAQTILKELYQNLYTDSFKALFEELTIRKGQLEIVSKTFDDQFRLLELHKEKEHLHFYLNKIKFFPAYKASLEQLKIPSSNQISFSYHKLNKYLQELKLHCDYLKCSDKITEINKLSNEISNHSLTQLQNQYQAMNPLYISLIDMYKTKQIPLQSSLETDKVKIYIQSYLNHLLKDYDKNKNDVLLNRKILVTYQVINILSDNKLDEHSKKYQLSKLDFDILSQKRYKTGKIGLIHQIFMRLPFWQTKGHRLQKWMTTLLQKNPVKESQISETISNPNLSTTTIATKLCDPEKQNYKQYLFAQVYGPDHAFMKSKPKLQTPIAPQPSLPEIKSKNSTQLELTPGFESSKKIIEECDPPSLKYSSDLSFTARAPNSNWFIESQTEAKNVLMAVEKKSDEEISRLVIPQAPLNARSTLITWLTLATQASGDRSDQSDAIASAKTILGKNYQYLGRLANIDNTKTPRSSV